MGSSVRICLFSLPDCLKFPFFVQICIAMFYNANWRGRLHKTAINKQFVLLYICVSYQE